MFAFPAKAASHGETEARLAECMVWELGMAESCSSQLGTGVGVGEVMSGQSRGGRPGLRRL